MFGDFKDKSDARETTTLVVEFVPVAPNNILVAELRASVCNKRKHQAGRAIRPGRGCTGLGSVGMKSIDGGGIVEHTHTVIGWSTIFFLFKDDIAKVGFFQSLYFCSLTLAGDTVILDD
jgi:hypothetical protein